MNITYIYHSSYCVEFKSEKTVLLFDYYKGIIPEFPKDSHVFVFASHKHSDHYDKKIFELAEKYPNITFILAKEIKMNKKYMSRCGIDPELNKKIIYVKANETYQIEETEGPHMQVETLLSTDSGAAFIIKCFSKCVYHAGDLNWWVWDGEPEDENEQMAVRFKKEIEKIKEISFDAAFLPLDPRQEDKFYYGFDYFMRNCSIQKAFPMHFWGKHEVIAKLKSLDCAESYREKIVSVEKEGQEFIL